jgi:hypothetical protein
VFNPKTDAQMVAKDNILSFIFAAISLCDTNFRYLDKLFIAGNVACFNYVPFYPYESGSKVIQIDSINGTGLLMTLDSYNTFTDCVCRKQDCITTSMIKIYGGNLVTIRNGWVFVLVALENKENVELGAAIIDEWSYTQSYYYTEDRNTFVGLSIFITLLGVAVIVLSIILGREKCKKFKIVDQDIELK